MFFSAFFGALFYTRMIAVPWLGGASNNAMTNAVLWPDFVAMWPIGLTLYNTILLLTSSIWAGILILMGC